ncbi:MAG: DUF2065 domain-containing protein [Magnetospirillum gryphiswaldense]|nr:DUF2065 domain-containing protein [Magnetospirillum gryphiswaldense]
MTDLLTALCLAVAFEGIAYAAFPDAMRRAMATILALPDQSLRRMGLVVAFLAVGVLTLLRSALITP